MRGMTAVLVCSTLWGAVVQGAEPTFPYTVQVAADEVEVRCGPGWDYYATQRLSRGTRVEVYRHDPGGWLAIRPPEGSFSWVTARHVQATATRGVAEIILDGAVAWVGSATTNVPQHKWQVRLKRGEQVEILGELPMTVGPGFATETYHKIAPPAGEFRWIHARHAVSSTAGAPDTLARSQPQSDYRHVSGSTASAQVVTPAAATRTTLSAAETARQVEELKVALALLVTQSIEQWDLASLKRRTETLAQQTVDAPLAREIKAISQRMDEFETLQRRHQRVRERDISSHQVSGVSAVDDTGNAGQEREPGTAGTGQAEAADPAAPRLLQSDFLRDIDAALEPEVAQAAAASQESRYDAEGWLMPVHSTKRVAPPFALLDDDGRVRAYVTPAPGLNLRRYTKQYVGLLGTRRYVDTLRAAHVTAERVVKQRDR